MRQLQGRVKRRLQDTEEILTSSGETSPHNKGKKRPQALDCVGTEKTRTKQGEVLPKDKRALEATSSDSSTDSDEGGAILASSSTAPWQRRVRLRTASAAKDKTQDPSPESQRSLWNFTSMASQRPGRSSLKLRRHGF